jgi:hypothetical protein
LESSPKQGLAGSVLNNPTLPPPQHDVVSLKRGLQPLHSVSHRMTPSFPSQSFAARQAYVVLKGSSLSVWQVCQFHGFEDSIDDQCRPSSNLLCWLEAPSAGGALTALTGTFASTLHPNTVRDLRLVENLLLSSSARALGA